MKDLSPTMKVRDIVLQRSSRARVLERFGIDYCCGGARTLAEASAEKGLDAEAVLDALRESDREPAAEERDFTAAPLGELIDHIVSTHHVYVRGALPRLGELLGRVISAHGENHRELLECRDIFQALETEMLAHLLKEEQILFPLIEQKERAAGTGAGPRGTGIRIAVPISVMENDHADVAAALVKLRELTNNYSPPGDACPTFRSLYEALAAFEADTHKHVHKENNILFPRAVALDTPRSTGAF